MADIKVILISSVRPEPTSGGQVTLYRHLIGQAGIEVEIYGNEPNKLGAITLVRRIVARLGRTRFHRVAEDFWALLEGRWLDGMLQRPTGQTDRTVVLTVAHGDACLAAVRFARKHKLPLITFFHDWWPDIPVVHSLFRRRLEQDFRQLYCRSSAALCVSEGMKANLGNHAHAYILHSIPKQANRSIAITPAASITSAKSFKVFYFGNLFEYGPMLGEALKLLAEDESIRLEIRGSNPEWPAHFRESMRRRGLFKDFVPRDELTSWLQEADAFLVAMAFEPRLRRRMETSFPSKLIEFVQFRKPLIIWGPEYCSAIRWARQGSRAACVTDRDPAALRQVIESLATSPDEQQRLAAAAYLCAGTDFDPDRIQAQFMEVLRDAIAIHKADKV
jgi:glycosyltransferase involved in cell wall biosynthesis